MPGAIGAGESFVFGQHIAAARRDMGRAQTNIATLHENEEQQKEKERKRKREKERKREREKNREKEREVERTWLCRGQQPLVSEASPFSFLPSEKEEEEEGKRERRRKKEGKKKK